MKKIETKKLVNVILGSMIMGLGISFTILANIGSDPMSVFWIAISKQLSISVGQANIVVCSCILVLVCFVDRKQIHIGSLLNPLCIALVTDIFTSFSFSIENYALRCVLCIIGLIVLAFGIALYALADYGKGAYEALVFCIQYKWKIALGTVRIGCDILFACVGFLLGGPVALGTILAIFCMGVGIQYFIKKLSSRIS